MGSRRINLLALAVLCLASALSLAWADPAPEDQKPDTPAADQGDSCTPVTAEPAFGPAAVALTPEQMAARIDQHIAAKWREKGVVPAPLADDAQFFRRLCLDIIGRIPSIINLDDFLGDDRPDKKRIWTELLMAHRQFQDHNQQQLYHNHFTSFWQSTIFSQTNQQARFQGFQMVDWTRNHVKNNTPFDKVVFDLLTNQQGYYQANENKAETIASNTSRLFLGIRLECAQCHDDRSGGNWTRAQFWEYAAFFANRNAKGGAKIPIPDDKKKRVVEARFLDGATPQWQKGDTSQTLVAQWLTSANNPYFAKAIVNRMWHYFLGVGLVDPVDAASEENLPSHPELLEELARQFVAHKFDLKFLIRSITASQAYQLTSTRTHPSQDDPRLYARMTVRGMTPEQLYDSLLEATDIQDHSPRQDPRFAAFNFQRSPRDEFLAKFTNIHDKRTETQTSILQALYLMNGGVMGNTLKQSKTLRTVQVGDQGGRFNDIERLYMVTLSRMPRPAELKRLMDYVKSGGPTKNREQALEDVFWALLNCGEFKLNH